MIPSAQQNSTDHNNDSDLDAILTQLNAARVLRIAGIGASGTGKSTLFEQLSDGNNEQDSTSNPDSDIEFQFPNLGVSRYAIGDPGGAPEHLSGVITALTSAQVMVLVVDATKGLQSLDKKHLTLASRFGPSELILVINKMDLVGYDKAIFEEVNAQFEAFWNQLDGAPVTAIPVSAVAGENVLKPGARMPWYNGPTFVGMLDTIELAEQVDSPGIISIQRISELPDGGVGYAGTIARGAISVGDSLRATHAGTTARVASLFDLESEVKSVSEGQSVTIKLDQNQTLERGEVLSSVDDPVTSSDQFEIDLLWLSPEKGLVGRNFDLKIASQHCVASVLSVKYRLNVDSLAQEAAKRLDYGDIYRCVISTNRPVAYTAYKDCQQTGSMILMDSVSGDTVAAGTIDFSLRRASNVHLQALTITRGEREKLNGHPGKVIWFTGLSGSGKSTIASALEVLLHEQGKRTYVLDGDNVRHGLNKDLGFTDTDRVENIRRIAEVAKLMLDSGTIVMTSFISPFIQEREMAKELIGAENFVEIYVDTPLEVCEQRDVKGLYKKARAGELPNMTGIDSPYEPPESPSLTVKTTDQSTDNIAALIAQYLDDSI